MDERKILLVNLAKGTTGEVNSNLLGLIIVAKLQMAALSRTNRPEEQRADFYLYLDEVHNFATVSLVEMLQETRKYRLALVMEVWYLDHEIVWLVLDKTQAKVREVDSEATADKAVAADKDNLTKVRRLRRRIGMRTVLPAAYLTPDGAEGDDDSLLDHGVFLFRVTLSCGGPATVENLTGSKGSVYPARP